MCHAIPAKITKILDDERAMVDVGGISREISLSLVKDCQVNDYVIIHVGYALNKLNEEEAKKTLTLFHELEDHTA